MKITKKQFEEYWQKKGRLMRIKNAERFYQNLADKIEEYGTTSDLDEYVVTLRKGKEITRKVVVDFYYYLEKYTSVGKPDSNLYDIHFYDYPFERQLEGYIDGIHACTFASRRDKEKESFNRVSSEYGIVLFRGMKETYPEMSDEDIMEYLRKCGRR